MRRLVPAFVALLAASVAEFAFGPFPGKAATGTPLAGTVVYSSYRSQALAGTEHFSVYLPAGYATSGLRYPVVYFLHGLPASATAYRSIQPIAQALDESGRQAILIGVQGSRSDDPDPEWLDWGPGRSWETATAKELVRVVDSRYRTIANRSGRALIGISGGGYGATLIGLHNPGVFSVVESWSGYFHPTTPDGTEPLDLGSTQANARASAHKLIAKVKQLDYFAFYVGKDDTVFRAENQQFAAELREAGIHRVIFRVYPGSHNWSLWSSHAPAWLGNALTVAAKPKRS